MSKIEIISSRSGLGNIDEMDTACAEMHIKDGTTEKYLMLSWASEANDILGFNITSEPIYDYMLAEELDDNESEKLNQIRDNGASFIIESKDDYEGEFSEQLKELACMIANVLRTEGFLDDDTFDDIDDVWPWLELTDKKFNIE